MLSKIPRNVVKDSGECLRRSWECYQRFQGMFKKIPGNVFKDYGECSKRFWGIF